MRKVDPAAHEEKRLEILEAAGACFARSGFQGASIADICAAANISPGHLYHYFSSKEAIIAAIAELRLNASLEAIGRVLEGPDPIRAMLRKMGETTPPIEQGATALALEVLAEAGRNPAVTQILQAHSRAVRRLVGEVLRKGQKEGKIDVHLDPDVASALLLSIVDGIKALPIHGPELNRQKAGRMVELLVSRFLSPS